MTPPSEPFGRAQPVPVAPVGRPRWWVAAPVALGLGVLGVPVAALSAFLWFVLVPLVLVLVAVGVTVSLVVGRTRPTADAVAVGLLAAPAVSGLGLGMLLVTGVSL